MKEGKNWGDVGLTTSVSRQPRCCILHQLKTSWKGLSNGSKEGVTVV